MHTETYIADDNTTLISKSFRDLKKYLDMVSYGQISIPYLTRFKKVIINNARSDFCVDEVKSLLSRGILQDAEEVEIKNPDDRFCTIDGMLYSGDKQKLYLCPRGKTGNLVIHDGAKSICDYACAWVLCDQVTIPDSIKSIGENAFAFNLNLKKVDGGRNIQNIKPFAFYRCYEVSTPMRCIAPIKVVSKTERSSEKYLQELPVKGFVLEAVPLSSFEHKANEPYADRANKGLFTKPPIHWQMMPKEYFGLRFAFKARA